ncbi:MAG TPA: enoyl-CoA hydratase [Rhodospirillales bacterium]|nr:enoyl-CoA hydratase [Rhodospirillales bacterium]
MTDTGTPELLREDREDGVTRLTLNRPKAFNALSRALLGALDETLDAIAEDPRIRVVVITGAGGRAFCAGHDLKEMGAERTYEALKALFDQCSRVMVKLTRIPQPVIARVEGIATAAGCQLVAACDLAICGEDSRFATSGVKYGLFCSTPMVALSRNVPRKTAMEMLLTGDFIDAAEARRAGLVNQVVPRAELDAAVDAMAGRLLDKPREVLALGKRAFYAQLEMGLEDAYAMTTEVIVDNALGRDFEEGLRAFLEKRKPAWAAG